jgi:hypothetical protein
MTIGTTRKAIEADAARKQTFSYMEAGESPDVKGMGAETAEYVHELDPQWMTAWKMFLDRDGNEYGVPVRVPIGQYFGRTPNHLENLRRPDGGHWFQVSTPERVQPEGKFECFVGDCTKKLDKRIKLVSHVRGFHFEEARTHATILEKIEQKVAEEDPRLQKLLASMDTATEFVSNDEPLIVTCPECGEESPLDHNSPDAWLRGHQLGAHKEKVNA